MDFEETPAPDLQIPTALAVRQMLSAQLANDETLSEPRTRALPYTGQVLVLGTAAAATHTRLIALNAAGDRVDHEALLRAESEARFRRFGKLEPSLYARLDEGQPIDIVIALRVGGLMTYRPLQSSPEAERVEYQDYLAEAAEKTRQAAEPVVAWLLAHGVEARIDEHARVIQASVMPDILRLEFLHASAAVGGIQAAPDVGALKLHEGAGSLGEEDLVGATQCYIDPPCCIPGTLCDGRGANVGILEGQLVHAAVNISRYEPTSGQYIIGHNAFGFRSYTQELESSSCTSDLECGGGLLVCFQGRCVDQHATWDAASLGMTLDSSADRPPTPYTFSKSGAPDVDLFYANHASFFTGWGWLVANNVRHVSRSQSFGAANTLSLVQVARTNGILIVEAAGNEGSALPADCMPWGSLCVGGYFYGADWDSVDVDGEFWPTSSWTNPTKQGVTFEWPHIVGPAAAATGVGTTAQMHAPSACSTTTMGKTACRSTYYGALGTSLAAPAIAGLAELIRDYAWSALPVGHPVVMKALLMAGARDVNNDGNTYYFSDGTDGKDGAGAPHWSRIEPILTQGRLAYVEVAPGDVDGPEEYVTVGSVFVPAGNIFKAVMAWNACAVDVQNPTIPDFDLRIERAGTVVWSSSSGTEVEAVSDNFFRLRKYGGTYVIKIAKKQGTSFVTCGSDTTEGVGVAWTFFGPV